MSKFLLVLTAALLFASSEARRWGQCELARELVRQGFPRSQIDDWICLVKHESNFDTSAIGRGNPDGSADHGIFQINDMWWCQNGGSSKNICQVRCKELRQDDITMAAICTKKVFKVHGFDGWVAWRKHCQGKSLPSMDHCFEGCRSEF